MRFVDNNTVEVQADFFEPVKNTDGSALNDLDYSSVYIISPAGTIKSSAIQESAATGGGAKSVKLLVNAPAGVKTTLKFAASSTDTSGNEGPLTPEVTLIIDRIGPAAPTGFIVA